MKHKNRSILFKSYCFVAALFFFIITNQERLSADENQVHSSDKDLVKRLDQLSAKIERLEGKVHDLDEKLNVKNALEISGFFDVSFSNYKNKPNVFAMGNLELDLEHSYDNKFQVAAALVFDDENGTYLGVGFIDYAFIGGPVPPRGRLFIERGLHVQVGRFDVPLGNDWNYVSAVNRITVTPPLTTSNLMEGVYNDVGIRLLFNTVSLNCSLYSTHGIEKQYSYGGISYGTRIGLTPFNNPYTIKQQSTPVFELGFSYLYDIDNQGVKSEQVVAVDYESKSGPLILRGEYYNREKAAGVVFEGYHLTSGLDFENINSTPFIIFLRYDYHLEKNNVITSDDTVVSAAAAEGESMSRVTGGVKFNISNTSFLKLEYHTYLTASERFREDVYFTESLYYAQLVITF